MEYTITIIVKEPTGSYLQFNEFIIIKISRHHPNYCFRQKCNYDARKSLVQIMDCGMLPHSGQWHD